MLPLPKVGLQVQHQGQPHMSGAFIGQHGSWNRQPRSGYKVIFVPFADGSPAGPPEDILTGFVTADGDALGRPVGVAGDRGGRCWWQMTLAISYGA